MKYKFSDVVNINPKEKIKKGSTLKKVSMQDLQENQRTINSYVVSQFSGGSKFRNKDTLFARITPCLENGKIAQVNILLEDELAFGSTEFIVFRAKNDITIPDYVYFLSKWNYVREKAIKSMTGTSGRQRVQNDVFDEIIIDLPSLENQKKISNLLNSFDKKIEVNNKIIENLEAQAQAIFKSWFVDFEPFAHGDFVESDLGLIPKGWEVSTTGQEFDIEYGKNLPTKKLLSVGYPVYGGNGQIGFYSNYLYDKARLLVSCRGAASGKVGLSKAYSFVTNNSLVFNERNEKYFYYYKYLFNRIQFENYVTGSAQPQLTIKNSLDIKVLVPSESDVLKFNKIVNAIFDLQNNLSEENYKLASIRNTLLPKLMAGEIDIANISIED